MFVCIHYIINFTKSARGYTLLWSFFSLHKHLFVQTNVYNSSLNMQQNSKHNEQGKQLLHMKFIKHNTHVL
jgi:hypothetical protein